MVRLRTSNMASPGEGLSQDGLHYAVRFATAVLERLPTAGGHDFRSDAHRSFSIYFAVPMADALCRASCRLSGRSGRSRHVTSTITRVLYPKRRVLLLHAQPHLPPDWRRHSVR